VSSIYYLLCTLCSLTKTCIDAPKRGVLQHFIHSLIHSFLHGPSLIIPLHVPRHAQHPTTHLQLSRTDKRLDCDNCTSGIFLLTASPSCIVCFAIRHMCQTMPLPPLRLQQQVLETATPHSSFSLMRGTAHHVPSMRWFFFSQHPRRNTLVYLPLLRLAMPPFPV
jgi:hypothetical protein